MISPWWIPLATLKGECNVLGEVVKKCMTWPTSAVAPQTPSAHFTFHGWPTTHLGYFDSIHIRTIFSRITNPSDPVPSNSMLSSGELWKLQGFKSSRLYTMFSRAAPDCQASLDTFVESKYV